MGLLRTLTLGLAAAAIGVVAVDLATFDRAAWAADYGAIKRGMAAHYANLDWVVDQRKVDLVALDHRTAARIYGARSHLQAFLALKDFAAAFGDPHLKLSPGREQIAAADLSSDEPADPPAGENCEADGYVADDMAFDPRMASLPGWKPVASGPFPAGLSGTVGVVRIASFGEDRYLAACQQSFTPGIGRRALQLATRERLQRQLAATIAGLKSKGARTLLIDLTGNGGGSEWDREAAALFTPAAMIRAEPRLANAPCNRESVWRGKRPCAVFAPVAGEIARVDGTGQWRGPVAILADNATGSAAEEFIGWLVDNKVARLIGTRTNGAGCGYVDGGAPVVLAAAPLTLRMPNCARYTAAGRNEIEGWDPDLPLAFPNTGEEPAWGKRLVALVGG